jgi:uncharacterized protein (UPF0210 family)
MQIRSITIAVEAGWPLGRDLCREAGAFLAQARRSFEQAGFVVQTTRLCTQPAHRFVSPSALPELARALDAACAEAEIPYCAAGGIALGGPWDEEATAAAVTEAIVATERIFSSIHIATDGGIDFRALRAAAATISRVAAGTAQGLGNLRFAALAQCPSNIPFFPAAFHAGGPRRFSIALQAADEVVRAFEPAGSIDEAEARLVAALEEEGARLERAAAALEEASGVAYVGADLSPAPFPVDVASVAGGLESLGLERFGGAGSVYASWRLTRALKRARLKQCGFSGLMMPVLEDSVLARRAAEGLLSVNELLLCSTVCGTGLDTVPLPGDVGEAELAGILLDVAALATALGKPLTARLLPSPGKRAGELTEFDHPFFVASRVLPVKGHGAAALLARALGEKK